MAACSPAGSGLLARRACLAGAAALVAAVCVAAPAWTAQAPAPPRSGPTPQLFVTSASCIACHNGLVTPSGKDVSIGRDWRSSMMANSARDPYWQAAVRRESIDHPHAAAEIEDECSVCHMPMARAEAVAGGDHGRIFAHLSPPTPGRTAARAAALAIDGVSCSACHQIEPEKLGTPASFTGGFVIDTKSPIDGRRAYGPFAIDRAQSSVMQSATGFVPVEGLHIRRSELCATCHTLYTKPFGPSGELLGRAFPEQVPYQEWLHSAYRETRSCQDCHMPVVDEPAPFSSVLGQPREGWRRHAFHGGNAFMQRMLNRFRDELGVSAPAGELAAAADRTATFVREQTAQIAITDVRRSGDRLGFTVDLAVLTGHKLPTGYPSRRAWLQVVVRDGAGAIRFASGRVSADGAIAGNANDEDPGTFERHYTEIVSADQVQIYEAIMVDAAGAVTTGLLRGAEYVKDNRLLPRGFDKRTASPDIAVQGEAATDPDFQGGGDRVRFNIPVGAVSGPLRIEARLLFQSIAFRWAHNLRPYEVAETKRFLSYYEAMASESAELVTETSAVVP